MNAVATPRVELADVLRNSPLPQLRRLNVIVNEQEVIISGKVTSYYMKQLAQESLRPWLGRRRLINRVEVCRHVPSAKE
ncbi:MAG: BON domain-containing protein [Gemmataceae bacterium]|nr:BON domain-containing protein [Gemmataceae bacterium]MCS7272144.1 BON domain-containing protein [Gemmataceae bacterium]MDW8243361.1 BON domain-containing protein [Thermogemmata sp.]